MIKKTYTRFKNNVPEFFIHFSNYFTANIAAKAVGFISIPIFTRFLTTYDYGVLNLFSTYVSIAVVVMTLNTYSSIGRYYYDRKSDEDFKEYMGTVSLLMFFLVAFFLIIFVFYKIQLADLLKIPVAVIIFIPIAVITTIGNSAFSQIMQPLYESKRLAWVTILNSYCSFIVAVLLLFVIN